MTPQRLQARAAFAFALVLVAFLALLGRLAQIQLRDHPAWLASAQERHWARTEKVPAQRGRILDRHGRVLALTHLVPSVALDPELVEDMPAMSDLLCQSLKLQPEQLADALDRGSRRFAYIQRHVGDAAAIEELRRARDAEGLRSLVLLREPRRVYPAGSDAAHVLGYTDIDCRGLEGVERQQETLLAGRAGHRKSRRDGRGRRIALAPHPTTPAQPGEDVTLALDAVVQRYAEQAATDAFARSKSKGVIAAVADVRTGEILGVACRPTFDPNAPNDAAAEARRNRFVTDVFEPGSTFKPIVMALALDAGVVQPADIFDCSGGTIRVEGHQIREDAHHDYGVLSASGVIARSSNVGMVMVGQRLGIERLHEGVRRLGFGRRTALGWPGESAGLMTPLKRWTRAYTLCSVSFGHEIAVTPAQLLGAYVTLANGGRAVPLRLLGTVAEGADPLADAPQVLHPDRVRDIIPMLEEVMRTGTGRNSALEEYRVAGKTGTAQKLTGGEVDTYVGSFACFGPAEDPRLAVILICDEPEGTPYGSVVAAPYATRLLRRSLRYLGVPASAPEFAPPPVPVVDEMEVYPR